MEWLAGLFDVSKLPFKIILWVAIISGILLFCPEDFLQNLKLDEFLDIYGNYVGIVFLAALGLVIIDTTLWISAHAKSRFQYRKWRNNLLSELRNLDHSEKAVLREFYLQGRKAIELPMDNATVASLKRKGIIYLVGNLGHFSMAGMLASFCLSQEVLNALTIDMIDLPSGRPSEKDKERLIRSRPDFAKRIDEEKFLFDF